MEKSQKGQGSVPEKKYNLYDASGKKLNNAAVTESELEAVKRQLLTESNQDPSTIVVRELLNG